jgi:O-antigen/teichoic acid export membrane protein
LSGRVQILRGILALGAAQVVTWSASGLLAILLPRYLGDVSLGKLTFAIAFTSLLGLITDLGCGAYMTKAVARNPGRAAGLTSNALLTRLPLVLGAGVLTVVLINVAGYDPLTRTLVYVFSVGTALGAINNVVQGALQGLQRMKVIATATAVSKVSSAALTLAVLMAGGGLVALANTSVAAVGLGLAIGVVALWRRVAPTARVDRATCRQILTGSMPFFVWGAALTVYGQIDIVILSLLTHDSTVGWYAAAYRIVLFPVFVPTIVMTVVFPALSAAADDRLRFGSIARRSAGVLVLFTLPMAAGIMLLSDRLITVFGYPASFAHSVLPMVLLAPHIPLAAVSVLVGTALNASDRQRQWAMVGAAAAVLNPLANLAAVPLTNAVFGNGAIGAAVITTLTEVFMLTVGLRLLPAGVFDRTVGRGALRCVAATLGMTAVVWLTRDLPLPVPVFLGALSYGAGCLATGAVSLGDLREVQVQLVRPRLEGRAASGASV